MRRSLLKAIREVAHRCPDNVAFVGGGRQPLTYVQLVEQISQVVAGLRRTGFQQGERVGVVLPDGPDLAVALIGISAAATVVPLSPATQDDELGRQLESLGCRSVVVAESDLERTARLSARGIDVLALARFGGAAGPFTLRTGGVASQTPAMIGAEPRWADVDDVALALHTSGTVGEPKLVLLTHANLSAAAAAIAEALELTARDRTLSVMPLFHIHGVSAVTATLMTGGSIACPGADGVMRLTEWLDHFRPTWLTASPTIHRELLTQARQQPDTIRHHALRFIRSASAPMPQSLIAQLEQLFAVPFIEAYGMTEASPQIASNRLAPHLRRTGSVGRAAGPEVAIVDEHGTPLQVGLEGEVVIRGNNVVTRYDGGDEANRDAFVNGWLRTGDLGRVDDDGFLFITGRIKDVINRGGEKISPLEIDRALLRHPAVRDALAYSVPHPTLGEDVAAAVVLESQLSRDDEDKVIGDIQQTLRGCLADFKIPQRIVVLDAIPGGTSGKVRRAALAAQVASGNASRDRTEGSPATGALEQRVAAIWAEVLGITPPFRDDNFFELGGDSLSAARVVARVARDMSLDAPGRILFEHPTPARMTAWLSSASHFTDIQGRPQIPSRVIRARKPEVPIPVSFQQYRLWVLDQLEPGNPAYNMHAAVDLEGLLDHAALDSALSEIVRRHQTLRTRFTVVAGQPTQVIAPPQKVRVPVVDLSALAAPERDAEAERLAAEEVRRPFHLRYGPLFRSALLRLAPTHHRLVLCVHHMVSDGWSMRIMLDELRTLYDAHRHGRSTPLAEPLLHYADFAAWQRDPSRQGEIDEDLRYWVSTFQKAPAPLRLPSDRARPSTPSGAGAVHRVRIDALTWQPLAALGRRLGATPFMTMMAAFQVLLSELSGQIDFAVGTPFAGRPDVGSEGLVGFFADTIAIRADLSGRPDFITALARVRRAALDASAHQRLPFDRLVDALTPERDLGVNPIFQVMFAFQNVPGHQGPTHWSSDLAATPAVIAPAHAKFDLTLYLDPDGDSLNATWLFARDLFELSTIERMSARFIALVGELANRPTEPLEIRSASSLPPAPEEHAAESLSEPTDIVTLVERHVQQTPHRVALACGPEQLTWTELNRLANGLARRLREAGVEPGATVGVCLDRSVDSIVAVLGVWKAGATYLPIDPAHPPAHIASVFGDARPFALVADRPIAGAGSLSTLAPRDVYEGGNTGDRDADPPRAVGLDALAYVIYTSGSTGRPKGVAVTHRNLAHYVRSLPSALGVGADDCWLHTASFAFSSSIRQIAVPLVTGARLEIATKAAIADPGELFGVIARAGVTVIDLVPSYARACQRVLASLSDAARGERLENRLRLILSASEPLTPAIVRSWRDLLGSWVELVNMFGQTETTGVVTLHRIGEADERSIASQISVGRPFGETHAFVLGEDGGTAPPGVEGELHLAGPQVCCGYLNDRTLTDARFLIDPTRPSQRIYRTGDLARCDADGTITLGGRIDRQVKVRGQRVEPEQVEAAIVRHPGWTEAAVVTEQDPAGFTRLTAVCTPAPGHDGDVAALRTWLARELPAILVPDRVIAAPALPRTPSGKVDRPALAGALVVAPTISSRRVDNTSPAVEGVITGIWKSLLQVERIGPNDNFFDLGGNSILALEMIARAHEAGLVIVPRQLWENQTIAELARVTVSSTARPQRPQSPPRNDPQPSRPTTSTTRPAVLVTVESLRAYGREALEGAGLRRDGAAIVTEAQLEASLRDQPTHNMVSIPRYARRLAAGTINPQPNIRIERETATSAHVDGDNGPGQWVADVAMQTAIGLARNSGVGIVGVRRSNHLGAAGHYPWMAAREGLIGICTTNGPVILAPTGGVTPTFGNNPIGVGIPAGQHFPIVLDVAMSVATRGKIGLELAEGRPLLEGWILDRLGRSSTDPADLVAGLGVPIGGHKGYGLALVMEVLAGVLTGANFGWANRRERALREARPAGFGHFFLAIDPELFMPAAEFTSRVDQLISEAKSSERAVGADEILIPGERELRARARSLREGVRLRASTYDSLVKYGKAAGLRTDLAVRDVADAPEPKTVTAR